MKLSIIIPVFNEERTIEKVLSSVSKIKIKNVRKEVIIVDDCSKDSTPKIIRNFIKYTRDFKFYSKKINGGKGSAIQEAVKHATGDYLIIQDADLEYKPKDIHKLTDVLDGTDLVIFGTRLNRPPHFKKEEKTLQFFIHYLGNRTLSLLTSILYGQWITDIETCYKLIPRNAFKIFKIYSNTFDFEPEVTAKLLKHGFKIYEVPIVTKPRDYKEGKKLHTLKDGSTALLAIFWYRFFDKPLFATIRK